MLGRHYRLVAVAKGGVRVGLVPDLVSTFENATGDLMGLGKALGGLGVTPALIKLGGLFGLVP